MTDAAAIELYVGTAIEQGSEREVLAALTEGLSSTGRWAVILANIHIGGRQIDFVAATDSLTLVVEAKHFSARVRGKVNGLWRMHTCGGAWKNVGNPYLQALQAKNVLRDQIQASYGERLGYPDACVVIAPKLPAGSDVPASDFKVAITDTACLAGLTARRSSLHLSKDQWRAFAQGLRLRHVQTLDAACNPKLLEQHDLLADYRSEFLRTYFPDAGALKSDTYVMGGQRLDACQVAKRAMHEGEDLLIRGPSGCGKTLLAKNVAIHCLEQGHIPIFLQAKYFAGKLGESIEREAVLLGAPSAASLIRAASAIGSPLVLVLDGYNECPATEQLILTRSLAAAARRYGTRLIVSTQIDIARPDLIGATPVAVKEPDKALKMAIAESSAGRTGHPLGYLLDSVSSGLEADLIGRVGASLADGASRFALFDAYARQKLGDDASEGIRLLAAIAGQLMGRMSFNLSIRDFDRVAAVERIHGDVLGRIVATGLVAKRSDRISFRHELIFSAFAAEFIVRQSNHDVEGVLRALRAPKYRNARSLILGAYDDDEFIASVLARTTDADLLQAASAGECGLAARRWVAAQCEQVLKKLTSEAASVEFSLKSGTWNGAGVSEERISDWTPAECALMATISDGVWRGSYLDQVLHAVSVMDRSLTRGLQALREEAREKKIALRSGLFADAYVISGKAGISRLLGCIFHSDRMFRASESEFVNKLKRRWEQPRTPGQTYLLLMLVRFAENKEFVVPHILPSLGGEWKYQPYHLQLELLNFVHFVRLSDDELRKELVAALDALLPNVGPVLSGFVIEALEQMGALEHEVGQHVGTIRTELRDLLSGPVDEGKCAGSWRVYVCQFDHPFSAAYCEVVRELGQDDRRRLLTMACQGADEYAGMFLAPLIQELVAYNDRSAAQAIERWLALPAIESVMPQEAVSVFVWAHVALGMLGVPLPRHQGTEEPSTQAALAAFGELYYWLHRQDLTSDELDRASGPVLGALLRPDQFGAASALHMVTRSMSHENGVRESVLRKFPGAMASICRRALQQPDRQIGYFPHFLHKKRDVLRFSIDLIGHVGGTEDLPLLRRLSEDTEIGESAIKAIELIERQSNSMSG